MDVILNFLNTTWESIGLPNAEPFGTFHLVCFGLSIVAAIVLCFLWKHEFILNPRNVAMVCSIIIFVFDLYEQIISSFIFDGTHYVYEYQWEHFPWQFYFTPMVIGIIAALTKNKVYDHFMSYLATYSLTAGLLTMFFPVFGETIGLCTQSMVSGGVVLALGVFLFYSRSVHIEHYTIIKALPILILTVSMAVSFNTFANLLGLEGFNAFHLNPEIEHNPNDIFIFSSIFNALRTWEFPWGYIISLVIYVVGFTAISYLVLLAAIGIRTLIHTDFDAEYAEEDAQRLAEKQAKERKQVVEAPVVEAVISSEEDIDEHLIEV